MRHPLSWLVFDEVEGSTILGDGPTFICGRAAWYADSTLIVMVRGKGRMEAAVEPGHNPNQVARTFLRLLHRTTAR